MQSYSISVKSEKTIGTFARNGGGKYCSVLQRNTEESFRKQSGANMYHIGSNFSAINKVLFHCLFL